ncbi:hypothetical protein D3C78_1431850 [compost metagenome]
MMAPTKPLRLMTKPESKYRVVIGAMRMPDSAPMKVASRKVALPARVGEMPISRAPRRLTAVARRALP